MKKIKYFKRKYQNKIKYYKIYKTNELFCQKKLKRIQNIKRLIF